MKGRTKESEMMEAPKSRKQPKDKLSKGGMVAGATRPAKMYGGGSVMGTKGTARGMGAAVKGGKFTDL